MANKQISEFATASKPFADTDIVHAKQGTSDKKMLVGDIVGEIASIGNYADCSGVVNSYILTPAGKSKAPSTYFDGFEITFKPNITNTSGSTVNYSSLGARNVYHAGAPVVAGDLPAGEDVTLIYNTSDVRFDVKLGSARYVDTTSNQEVNGTKTFTQAILAPSIEVDSGEIVNHATLAGDATYWLKDDAGVSQGLLQWDRASDEVTLSRYDGTGVNPEGELVLNATSLTWNGGLVWNSDNDGPGSGLNADLLDNLDGSQFMRSDVSTSTTGSITANGGSILIDAVNTTANSNLWLRKSNNQNSALMYYEQSTDLLHLRKYDAATGTVVDGQISMGGNIFRYNGSTVWHTGNDANLAKLDGADFASLTIAGVAPVMPSQAATTAGTGLIEIATDVEAIAGTDSDRAIVPSSLQAFSEKWSPVGQLIIWGLDTPPEGFIECNGAAISRSVYSRLFSVIGVAYGAGDGATTFQVPDFRGEFIRGWDNGRGVDVGRTIGSAQSDAFQGHGHDLEEGGKTGWPLDNAGVAGTGSYDRVPANSGVSRNHSLIDGPVTRAWGTVRIANETRPRNISVMLAIKY